MPLDLMNEQAPAESGSHECTAEMTLGAWLMPLVPSKAPVVVRGWPWHWMARSGRPSWIQLALVSRKAGWTVPSNSVRCPLKYVDGCGGGFELFEAGDFELCVAPRVPVANAWLLWKNLHTERWEACSYGLPIRHQGEEVRTAGFAWRSRSTTSYVVADSCGCSALYVRLK